MQLDLGLNPTPFISVILPTFNREHLIRRAIESLLQQTFQGFELIVVDDGSRDNTFGIVRPYVESDARIRYHFASNRGLAVARNLGIKMSIGSYLTFLDSDDEYLPEHLASRAEFLRRNPEIELLHGGVEIVGDPYVADKHNPTARIHISDCVVGGTFFLKRTLLERMGGFHDVTYGDDSDFFDRATRGGAVIEKVMFPTYRYYRNEPDSLCAIVEREGVAGIEVFRSKS